MSSYAFQPMMFNLDYYGQVTTNIFIWCSVFVVVGMMLFIKE